MATVKRIRKQLTWQGQLILIILVLCSVLFIPTTILLIAGMLPTIVAAYADRTKERMRAITVGSMNLAGCTPFIMELWLTEHTINQSMHLLSDPLVWLIMYAAAAIGYCIEWAVVGAVSVFTVERAQVRIKHLKNKQEELVARWGEEVTGRLHLDEYGFPIKDKEQNKDTAESEKTAKSS